MVIQSKMSTKMIAAIWPETAAIFEKYHSPISERILQEIVSNDVLTNLLADLNNSIGSSSTTCIEGG
jgi:uncharacterized protein YejL (UPF0352 family)